jgi:hypothetical protein
MNPQEPAGSEDGRGKSAELVCRARWIGGAVGNTCGTVCGENCRGAIRLQSCHVFLGVYELSVGACLYRLFILYSEKTKSMEDTQYEV